MDRGVEFIQVKKVTSIDEVNYYLTQDNLEMQGCWAIWEFLGCGCESVSPGIITPFYILGLKTYSKPETINRNNKQNS